MKIELNETTNFYGKMNHPIGKMTLNLFKDQIEKLEVAFFDETYLVILETKCDLFERYEIKNSLRNFLSKTFPVPLSVVVTNS